MIRAVLSPSKPVKRKLSPLVPACGLPVELVVPPPTGVPLARRGPPAVKNVELEPGGTPAVDAGLKYGAFSAFNISTRNSNDVLPCGRTRLTALRSNRTSRGPFTMSVRMPQSPKPADVSMQSGPLAGARYRPVGAPSAPYPFADVARSE